MKTKNLPNKQQQQILIKFQRVWKIFFFIVLWCFVVLWLCVMFYSSWTGMNLFFIPNTIRKLKFFSENRTEMDKISHFPYNLSAYYHYFFSPIQCTSTCCIYVMKSNKNLISDVYKPNLKRHQIKPDVKSEA